MAGAVDEDGRLELSIRFVLQNKKSSVPYGTEDFFIYDPIWLLQNETLTGIRTCASIPGKSRFRG